jgi:hypothetical protein
LVAAASLDLFVASSARAQRATPLAWPPIVVSAAGGFAASTGAFAERAKGGFHVTGAVSLQEPDTPYALRIDLMYSQFTNVHMSGTTGVFGLTGNVIAGALPGAMGPYFIGGVGVYAENAPEPLPSSNATVLTTGATDNAGDNVSTTLSPELGFNIGAGIRFKVAGLSAYLEAQWHRLSSGDAFAPITVGVVF